MLPVTVVIPTTGRQQLVRAVRSVLNQSQPPAEIIACFDGPLSSHSQVISELMQFSSSKLKFIELLQPSGGPGKPRNVGLALSTQPYVAFLDDDDRWMPNKLEKQFRVISSDQKILGVGSNAFLVDQDEMLGLYFQGPVPRSNLRTLSVKNPLIASSLLCVKNALIAAGGFSEDTEVSGIADYLLWSKLAVLGRIINLSEPLVEYQVVGAMSLSSAIQKGNLSPVETTITDLKKWTRQYRGIWFKSFLVPVFNMIGKAKIAIPFGMIKDRDQ